MFKNLLLVGAASLGLALAASAASAGDFSGPKTTICHRTGNTATAGVFRGNVLSISNSAVGSHLSQHGDVVIPDSLLKKFASGDCGIDAAGNLYDGAGKPAVDKPKPAPEPKPEPKPEEPKGPPPPPPPVG
jgi:hypothetical protein